ncbi:uncharacterized protein K452DRAFT_167000 [Aplosporella prunicola CBS 121167]|uniref:Uncharacterized protein n=1 Tax=Aplosporella prunicola CBS 121167 TaxID=1176127 RepID=A0A6A6BIP0_9PEZI|nr:uncharacterized protein K452DRAFT_167000 [Aplosporella prunicola CBS 121167]KAF2143134.1 hypothetical protein K452DRAFT_167000 [Aplosporella prunicola CBS 121167]
MGISCVYLESGGVVFVAASSLPSSLPTDRIHSFIHSFIPKLQPLSTNTLSIPHHQNAVPALTPQPHRTHHGRCCARERHSLRHQPHHQRPAHAAGVHGRVDGKRHFTGCARKPREGEGEREGFKAGLSTDRLLHAQDSLWKDEGTVEARNAVDGPLGEAIYVFPKATDVPGSSLEKGKLCVCPMPLSPLQNALTNTSSSQPLRRVLLRLQHDLRGGAESARSRRRRQRPRRAHFSARPRSGQDAAVWWRRQGRAGEAGRCQH